MPKKLLFLLIFTGIAVAGVAEVRSQTEKSAGSNELVRTVLDRRGWLIPPSGTLEKTQSGIFEKDGISFTLTFNSYYDSPLFLDSNYHLHPDGTLSIVSINCRAMSSISYRFRDREFAHKFIVQPAVMNGSGKVEGIGIQITQFYIDGDGDGVFETRSLRAFNELIPGWIIPEWVKKLENES